mgnify:CR=1 FL=1
MMHSVEIKPENHIQINLHAPDADLFIALADGRSKLLSKSNPKPLNGSKKNGFIFSVFSETIVTITGV